MSDVERVYRSVRDFCFNHEHKFENVFVHSWEADHFSITKGAGYSYEIEVKVSRSDFLADFKKPKHHLFKSHKKGYGILPCDASWIKYGRHSGHVKDFPELIDYKIEWRNIKALQLSHKNCPNRFMYACPVGLIEAHEVPDYAGLLYVMDSGEWRVVKKPPLLHKDATNEQILFNKYVYRSMDQEYKIRESSAIIENLLNALENPKGFDIPSILKRYERLRR